MLLFLRSFSQTLVVSYDGERFEPCLPGRGIKDIELKFLHMKPWGKTKLGRQWVKKREGRTREERRR